MPRARLKYKWHSASVATGGQLRTRLLVCSRAYIEKLSRAAAGGGGGGTAFGLAVSALRSRGGGGAGGVEGGEQRRREARFQRRRRPVIYYIHVINANAGACLSL